jgi:hypothetical protein
MVVLPQAGPSADASQAMLSNIQVPHGPRSAMHRTCQHLRHTAFSGLPPGRTRARRSPRVAPVVQAMATLQYRMFGLAALGNSYTQVDR